LERSSGFGRNIMAAVLRENIGRDSH